jgi:GT2 family glycosyltransferase
VTIPRRSIAAVVLNYRTAPQTITLVRSLQRSSAIDRVLVVDNASGDDSVTRFKRELDGVEVLAPTHNRGFSTGCNDGIRQALGHGADRLLLLNPDVVVQAEAVAGLDEVMAGGGDVVGPVLVQAADSNCIESGGITYSPLTGRMRHRLSGASRTDAQIPDVADVDGVSGCAMLVRREVFEAVGLFAEEYFYGFEDLEFCLRAKAAGFRAVCAGRAVVAHEGAASIGRDSPRRLYFAARNHLLLASRVGPQAWPIRLTRAVNVVGLNIAHALVRSGVPIAPGLWAIGRGLRDHLKARYGPDENPPA